MFNFFMIDVKNMQLKEIFLLNKNYFFCSGVLSKNKLNTKLKKN